LRQLNLRLAQQTNDLFRSVSLPHTRSLLPRRPTLAFQPDRVQGGRSVRQEPRPRYNAEWLIEKNGRLSPVDASAARLDTPLRRAA
ncbi:MAG: hypothetical protein NTW37_22130, partial [Proteobacteria bacterium]|nr:hypothetical protein [Pseudomonadota bacterium]